ncbi:MAG: aldehyde dehydrogenase [Deltaproteobacteria bacterium]|nr:aldehyde dehydrogenase [Deltaproteobacteria bacterium]
MPDVTPHLPALRWGDEYRSLTTSELRDHRTGAVIGVLSQVNAGLVRRDLKRAGAAGAALRSLSVREIVARSAVAADLFESAELPLADGLSQTASAYREQLAATAALPHALARDNQAKIASVLRELPAILRGLTRGLAPGALDHALAEHDGIPLWFVAQCEALGAVLPSNSPGVNALWLPALAMRVPVLLKPGNADPWTPLRLARALAAAGLPEAALGILPTDHEGASALLDGCGRALLFGDARTTAPWAGRASVEVHGPGRSKVWIGSDEIERWESHLDVLVDSIARNGGRSCINASAIVVPRHADAIAAALAERLAALRARALDDREARLAGFADSSLAERIDGAIEDALRMSGAEDVSARTRGDARLVAVGGTTFLQPTIVRCARLDHPLANTEYLFPYASVVEVADAEALDWMGDTLVLTAITRERANLESVTRSTRIGRLHLGPMATPTVRWDQPHEGNLFDFLYARRAIGRAGGW